MTTADPYLCVYCGAAAVVPGLARDCEKRHEEAEASVSRDPRP